MRKWTCGDISPNPTLFQDGSHSTRNVVNAVTIHIINNFSKIYFATYIGFESSSSFAINIFRMSSLPLLGKTISGFPCAKSDH